MPKAHLLTHGPSGSVHSAWHTEADAKNFLEHYNLYRESDHHLHYMSLGLNVMKKQPQQPGWYCEIDIKSGEIKMPPRSHSFTPERRPQHLVSNIDESTIAILSFVSAEHAVWAVKQERARYHRKKNND